MDAEEILSHFLMSRPRYRKGDIVRIKDDSISPFASSLQGKDLELIEKVDNNIWMVKEVNESAWFSLNELDVQLAARADDVTIDILETSEDDDVTVITKMDIKSQSNGRPLILCKSHDSLFTISSIVNTSIELRDDNIYLRAKRGSSNEYEEFTLSPEALLKLCKLGLENLGLDPIFELAIQKWCEKQNIRIAVSLPLPPID